MSCLRKEIERAVSEDIVPLHMPGHKKSFGLQLDTTELEDTDDLHNAGGVLKTAMERTAALYGAERTWYLVNGSTCGILAAVRAAAPSGGFILCARNCHRSVYHAVELCRLDVQWLAPEYIEEYDIFGSLPPERVREAVSLRPDCRAVIVTSPTYEGVISDIREIADICHSHGIPLIVDEAHGAHLGLSCGGSGKDYSESFPAGAVAGGADIVIQSPHKTLTSFTQSAWMHLTGDIVNPKTIDRQLDIFETSSPSYPLMISLDECTELFTERGTEILKGWRMRLDRFYESVKDLDPELIRVFGYPLDFQRDPSKILIRSMLSSWPGRKLYEKLSRSFGIRCEMHSGMNVLAMTGPGDSDDALDRLSDALHRICEEMKASPGAARCEELKSRAFGGALVGSSGEGSDNSHPFLSFPESVCTIAEALECSSEIRSFDDAVGAVSAEYVWCYPPGIPLLAPGERITDSIIRGFRSLLASGTPLHSSYSNCYADEICVVQVSNITPLPSSSSSDSRTLSSTRYR